MTDKHADEFDAGLEDGKSIKTIEAGNYLVDTTTGETFELPDDDDLRSCDDAIQPPR